MKNKFKILFVSPEVAPFAQTCEVGEVSGALPKYLKNLGHDIRVMMPNYKSINERKYVLRDVIRLQGLEVKLGDQELNANGKSAFIPDSKVQIYFLDNKDYFDRSGLYSDENTGLAFEDNAERFLFFCKGCLETLKLLYWQPDIIHCNDWQTAFIPVLLKTVYQKDVFFKNTRTLLSIHDFKNQAVFNASLLAQTGIDDSLNGKPGQGSRKINLLQLGMKNADMLHTVSETYVDEALKHADNGAADVLQERKKELISIPYGIDPQVWNPETDPLIKSHYSAADVSGKAENKRALLQHFNLEGDESVPLIGMVSQLTYEKGIELVLEAVAEIMNLKVNLVISGNGDREYQKKLQALQKNYAGRIGLDWELDPATTHLITAGSDLYLMPSRSEPCGLGQLHCMTYGTVPIVRKTGGLAETVNDFTSDSSSGTGFVFEQFKSAQLLAAVRRALGVFSDKEAWEKVMTNAMKQDFSWNAAVARYVKIYQKMMGVKK